MLRPCVLFAVVVHTVACTPDATPGSEPPAADRDAVADADDARLGPSVPAGPAVQPVFELHRIRVHRFGERVHLTALGELRHAGPPVVFGGYRPAGLVGPDALRPDVSLSLVRGHEEAYIGSATWPVPRLRPGEHVGMRIVIDHRRFEKAARRLGVDLGFLDADVPIVEADAAGEAFTYYDAPAEVVLAIGVDVDTEPVAGDGASEAAPSLRIVPRATDCFRGPLLPMCQWFVRVDNQSTQRVGMLVGQAVLRDAEGKVAGVDTTDGFEQKRHGGLSVDVLEPSASAWFTVGSHVADPAVLVADAARRRAKPQPPEIELVVWGAIVP